MRSLLLLAALAAGMFAACNCVPAAVPDAGADGGGGGAGGGSGADGGSCATSTGASTWPQRTSCDLLGTWTITSLVADPAWDAGGSSPCLPLPPTGRVMSIGQELGTFNTSPDLFVQWTQDAGCSLQLDYSYSSSNPSETYCHAVSLQLNLVDVGELFGTGTYRLSGGSNCTVPIIADVRRP